MHTKIIISFGLFSLACPSFAADVILNGVNPPVTSNEDQSNSSYFVGSGIGNQGSWGVSAGGNLVVSNLNIGNDGGVGAFTVSNGGTLTSNNGIVVGVGTAAGQPPGVGTFIVDGPGTSVITPGLVIGNSNDPAYPGNPSDINRFSLTNGATLTTNVLIMGQLNTQADVAVIGQGSTLSIVEGNGLPGAVILPTPGGNANLTIADGGTLEIGGNGAGFGATSAFIEEGGDYTVTLDNGQLRTIGSQLAADIPLTIKNNATFDTNGLGMDLSGPISGSGTLIKTGADTLKLSGTNTYTGGTQVDAGTLLVGSAGAVPNGNPLTINGGTLQLAGNNLNVSSLSGNGGQLALAGDTLTVDQTGNTQWNGLLTGNGSLVKQGNGGLTLNGANSYTGTTQVDAGILQVGTNGALPANTALVVNGGQLQLGANDLTAASLSGSGGAVVMNGNALTINQTATTEWDGQLTGDGSLIKQGNGSLTLNGANTYTGTTQVDAGTLAVGSAGSLPTNTALVVNGGQLQLGANDLTASSLSGSGGALAMSGSALTLNQNSNTTWNGQFSGNGALIKQGSGSLTLNTDSPNFVGDLNIEQGNVSTNGDLAQVDVTVSGGASLSGTGLIGNTTLQPGATLSVGEIGDTSGAALNRRIGGSLDNHGMLLLGRNLASAGNTLTVTGDYQGYQGQSVLQLVSVLGDDQSQTNKLIIEGNAKGKTDIQVANLGGKGDQTINGIEVVQVGGTSDNGAFYNSQAISAGLYNYSVVQKGTNYYLTSDYVGPTNPTDPGDPGTPGNPGDPGNPGTPGDSGEKNIRAVAGAWIANAAAANTLFNFSREDRITAASSPASGNPDDGLWLRQQGGQNRFTSGNLKTQSNRYVVQLGSTLFSGQFAADDGWNVGIMGGYAQQHSRTHSTLSNSSAKAQIHGYSTGIYASWVADTHSPAGLWVDSWLQHSWFDNNISEQGKPDQNYRSRGFSGSVESGYNLILTQGERYSAWLAPEAQLTWMNVRSQQQRDSTNTRINAEGAGNLQSRLGVRAWLDGHSQLDDRSGRHFRPYVAASWIHNTRRFGVTMDDASLSQQGAKNLANAEIGVTGYLSQPLSINVGIDGSVGDRSYSDVGAQFAIKYQF